jgi:hypothetical protein
MPVQHLKASALVRKSRNASCFRCGDRATEAKDDGTWTIWTSDMTYCPRCAKKEGIGPEDY